MTDISLNSLKHWLENLSVFRSKTLFPLLQHRIDFSHHALYVAPANEGMMDGAIGIDEHPDGHTTRFTGQLTMQRLQLLLG